jgi:hypothetical protein
VAIDAYIEELRQPTGLLDLRTMMTGLRLRTLAPLKRPSCLADLLGNG